MAKIITVHGTFAGAEEDSGLAWWQLDSPFHTQLGKLADLTDVEYVPFHWQDGPNSEIERRKAGRQLYELFAKLEDLNQTYGVLAHSHGGNVAWLALLYAVKNKRELRGLKALITVGTPFLDMQKQRFLFSRLSPAGLFAFVFFGIGWVIPLLLAIGYVFDSSFMAVVEYKYGSDSFRTFYAPAAVIYLELFLYIYVLLRIVELFHKNTFSKNQKNAVFKKFRDRCFGIWHTSDEAIFGLKNIAKVRMKLIQPTTIARLFTFAPLGFIAITMIYVIVSIETIMSDPCVSISEKADGLEPPTLFPEYIFNTSEELDGGIGKIMWVLSLLIAPALLWMMFFMLAKPAEWFGRMVGYPVSAILDRMIWSQIRNRIRGSDMNEVFVRTVDVKPPGFSNANNPLPEPAASRLTKISNNAALQSIDDLRKAIATLDFGKGRIEHAEDFGVQFTMRELIHNSYFDLDDIRRLIAIIFAESGISGLRSGNWTSRQKHQARAMVSAIQTSSDQA